MASARENHIITNILEVFERVSKNMDKGDLVDIMCLALQKLLTKFLLKGSCLNKRGHGIKG